MLNAECEAGKPPGDLRARTFDYALRVIRMFSARVPNWRCNALYEQLLRSGTSVGANYRSAVRARSTPELIAKLGIVEEECDETIYSMELLTAAGFLDAKSSAPSRGQRTPRHLLRLNQNRPLPPQTKAMTATAPKEPCPASHCALRIPHSTFP